MEETLLQHEATLCTREKLSSVLSAEVMRPVRVVSFCTNRKNKNTLGMAAFYSTSSVYVVQGRPPAAAEPFFLCYGGNCEEKFLVPWQLASPKVTSTPAEIEPP